MSRDLCLVLVAAALIATGAASVAQAQDGDILPYQTPADIAELAGAIEADGSSTVGPITQVIAEEFGAVAPRVETTVAISGTGGGFERFCEGETDIQNASRAIKAEEHEACAEAGVDYYELEVAYDGISVIANPEDEFLDCLTVEELRRLWEPDSEVDTWRELNTAFPDAEVELYGPGPDSGTFDYFTEEIVGEEGASRTDYTPSEDDYVVVEGVSFDRGALGYLGYAYYEASADDLRLVGVDAGEGCVRPNPETIRTGAYSPLSRPLYVYVNAQSLERPEVREFVRFYLANAATLVPEVGYIPSPTDVYAADQAKLEAAISGEGEPDGPAGEV